MTMFVSFAAGEQKRDYSAAIVGCWQASQPSHSILIFHADGTWGWRPEKGAPEHIVKDGRWYIEAGRLVRSYHGHHGWTTESLKIVSLTEHKMVLEATGLREEFSRYSADSHIET